MANMFALTLFALMGLMLFAIPHSADATLEGSPHDFSTDHYGFALSSCEFCHPRHSEDETAAAVWRRTRKERISFNIYDPIANETSRSRPGTSSLICLGCHDSAVGRNIHVWEQGSLKRLPLKSNCIAYRTINGMDYTSEHPVGFVFVEASRSLVKHGVPSHVFMPAFGSNSTGYGFKLDGTEGTFECITCHDVHDNDKGSFLRAPKGTICMDCHQNR